MKPQIEIPTEISPVPGCNNAATMKPKASTALRKTVEKPDMKSGLPGTPEERLRDLRMAMKKNEETLRRLAR